jgi:hypothetical protein
MPLSPTVKTITCSDWGLVVRVKSDADGAAVVARMKLMPTDDKLFGKGLIQEDGRKIQTYGEPSRSSDRCPNEE